MQKIKYTKDNKKVIVVGKLNTTDYIVQEIFIQNGNEIPSGENFVVKTLHDAPSISWKEKRNQEIEETYNNRQKEYKQKINNLDKSFNKASIELKLKIQKMQEMNENLKMEQFQLMFDFLCGDIKYIVIKHYSGLKLKSIDDFSLLSEYNFDRLKLITIFGDERNKNLDLCLNSYSDGSGGHQTIVPFKTKEDAFKYIEDFYFNVKEYNCYVINTMKEYNLKFDEEKLNNYKEQQIKSINKNILKQKELIQKNQESIKEINNIGN